MTGRSMDFMGFRASIRRRTAAAAAALIVMGSQPARSHLGSFVYPIYELPTSGLPDLHDGTLADWEEALPDASLTHNDFVYNGGVAGGIDPGNLAFRVFLAWHHASQRIFVAVERLDDDYWPVSEGGIEPTYLYVDGDHSGGQFAGFHDDLSDEERRRLQGSQAQRYTMSSEPPFPNTESLVVISGRLEDWAVWPPWTEAGGFHFGEAPNLSGVELAVTPWDDLNWEGRERSRRSVLEPGRIVGFLVELWDVDRDNRTVEMFSLVRRDATPSTNFAEDFADGELVPCNTGDCSQARSSAVRADSWGRIKAALR